jgi:hypothetical protein
LHGRFRGRPPRWGQSGLGRGLEDLATWLADHDAGKGIILAGVEELSASKPDDPQQKD